MTRDGNGDHLHDGTTPQGESGTPADSAAPNSSPSISRADSPSQASGRHPQKPDRTTPVRNLMSSDGSEQSTASFTSRVALKLKEREEYLESHGLDVGENNDDIDNHDSPDHWLDQVTQKANSKRGVLSSIMQETFGQPIFIARRMWGFVSTSPGKITLMTVIISIAIFAAGYAMSVSSESRQSHLDELITNTEPLSYNAHVLYTSLSVADTTATTGFVQAGIEGPINRVRYNTAIDQAAVAATDTATSANNADAHLIELVTEIQRQLPVYTGLVETARTNNRAGNPVSVAYMAEASSMMRNDILPMAAELYNMTSRAVADQQSSVTRPQWIPLSGLLAALAMLLIAQWWLMRITRRRINKGFALAMVLLLTATLWVSVSNWVTWNAGTKGFEEASGPLNSMTISRIYAQQTRTTETLALVRRQSVQGSTTGFNATISQIKSSLEEYETTSQSETPEHQELIRQIRNAIAVWTNEHARFNVLLESGDYNGAVDTVLSADEEGQTSFDVLDNAMSELITDSRVSMRNYIKSGLEATELVSIMVMILSIAAVLSLWIGIRARLQEYL